MTFRENEKTCLNEVFCKDSPQSREYLPKAAHCALYPDLDYYKKGNEDDWQNRLKGNRCKSNSEDNELVSAPIIGAFKERY